MAADVVAALTSLPPGQDRVAHHRACIASWRTAGLEVFSFNHPEEIQALGALYDARFVPVPETAAPIFGRPYVPINVMLGWAARRGGPVLLINADIELRMAPWEMRRLRWLCDRRLCYFVRYNYAQDMRIGIREVYGIDAFLLNGGDADLFPDSFLSMGQPFWDYWIPYTFAARDFNVFAVEFPALFHRDHSRQWSYQAWHLCALEFDRLFGLLGEDQSMEACLRMSGRVRSFFDSRKIVLPAQPAPIRHWVEQTFSHRGPKLFLELGAHDGSDTAWMAALPEVTIHAFEPDPRNDQPPLANVHLTRAAISDQSGRLRFTISNTGWGQPWTHSSSLKQPKNHLARYPVTFGETIEIDAITLDAYARLHGLHTVDFIWANVQGAEGEMIRGGRDLLSRTRYLYTEYSDDQPYEGQVTLKDICAMLPEFRVIELWPYEVLLQNQNMVKYGRRETAEPDT
jgi:FkbM family methyltransferase